MSQFAIILGRSGSGKSRSIKNLDPSKTYIINCLGKTLPFKQSATMYNTTAKNICSTYNWEDITKILIGISKDRPHITTCVIDDATFVMREEFFDRSKERGYEKYSELANHFRTIINTARKLREDLHIYMILHEENIESDGSIIGKKVATVGKLLDKQYDPLMSVTITLYCEPKYNENGTVKQYGFYTREQKVNGVSIPSKTPEEMFEDDYIPNDLALVNRIMDDYYGIQSSSSESVNK